MCGSCPAARIRTRVANLRLPAGPGTQTAYTAPPVTGTSSVGRAEQIEKGPRLNAGGLFLFPVSRGAGILGFRVEKPFHVEVDPQGGDRYDPGGARVLFLLNPIDWVKVGLTAPFGPQAVSEGEHPYVVAPLALPLSQVGAVNPKPFKGLSDDAPRPRPISRIDVGAATAYRPPPGVGRRNRGLLPLVGRSLGPGPGV